MPATTNSPPKESSSSSSMKKAEHLINENRDITLSLYGSDYKPGPYPVADDPQDISRRRFLRDQYSPYAPSTKRPRTSDHYSTSVQDIIDEYLSARNLGPSQSHSQKQLVPFTTSDNYNESSIQNQMIRTERTGSVADEVANAKKHPKWRVFRIMSGHLGWVRCVVFDTSNLWFATGSADRTIKVWDSASGKLRLTLTGHVSGVRSLAVSEHRPYMFSAGEDKAVKCWDLERNTVIRNYHGHLSGVYSVAVHPSMDVLFTGGRDSTVRVWDIRTRSQVMLLGGHRDTVNDIVSQQADPQVISVSADSTIRLWDLAAGSCSTTLTHHKKGIRAVALHPREWSFVSTSADAVKTWGLPKGIFMRNWKGVHNEGIVNAIAVNEDGVAVTGGDNGIVGFWDYNSASCFDQYKTVAQPGSLECEAGVFGLSFDKSGSRLVSCETDKTVRMWKEIFDNEEDE